MRLLVILFCLVCLSIHFIQAHECICCYTFYSCAIVFFFYFTIMKLPTLFFLLHSIFTFSLLSFSLSVFPPPPLRLRLSTFCIFIHFSMQYVKYLINKLYSNYCHFILYCKLLLCSFFISSLFVNARKYYSSIDSKISTKPFFYEQLQHVLMYG